MFGLRFRFVASAASVGALFAIAYAQQPAVNPSPACSYTHTTHHVQTLSDGNVIDVTTAFQFARDAQGRTWEQRVQPASGSPGAQETVINISDPVNGNITIYPDRKFAIIRPLLMPPSQRVEPIHVPPIIGGSTAAPVQPTASRVTENLGTKSIDGVDAIGTRTTVTTPAGQMGNAQPIVVVSEVWRSPSLRLVLSQTTTDPRNGTTTVTVDNLQIGDPSSDLFTIPSDYQVATPAPNQPLMFSANQAGGQ